MHGRLTVFLAATLVACAIAGASAQSDPGTALVARAAWDALAKGQTREAATAFRDAIARDPKNARLHLGSGIVAMLERRDRDAIDAFEAALFLDPKLTEARTRLGLVQYRTGDVAGAIRSYETLAADAPSDADAHATLDRWRREQDLHDRMQNAIGSHFTVSFEGPAEAALARKALESLDRAYWRIGQELGIYPSDPIRVVLYTTEQFRDITRSPSWVAGAYDGTIRVPMLGALDKGEELDRVLAHEFTHAVVRTLGARNVPTWLNEGLAAALESHDLAWADKLADKARQVPLRALQNGFTRFNGDQAVLAYAASARAVRRLLDEGGGFAIANLLRDLGAGIGFDAAFLHRFQRPFADFQTELAAS
jgi:tetratricopeptide (TPR) repeat protein